MPRVGLTSEVVVAEAEKVVDEIGLDGLTLSGLAERLGVRQPSLYKHIDGLAGLRRAVAVRAAGEVTDILRRATIGRARGDAIAAMAEAHRTWALAHPFRYPLSQLAPAPGDTEHERVAGEYLQMLSAVLSGFGLAGADAIDAIRAMRSVIHGFISLETAGGFAMPFDIDRSFRRLVAALIDGLENWSAEPASLSGPA